MLDTLIVLLMKGVRAPILRALTAFLFLCAGIGALLLLITFSGLKWPGMDATASSVRVMPSGAASALTPTVPILHILHNPCVASPAASVTPGQSRRHTNVQQSGYNYTSPAPQRGGNLTSAEFASSVIKQGESAVRNILIPFLTKSPFKDLSAHAPQTSCLSNSLATSASKSAISRLGSFFLPLLSISGLLMLCGLGLFVTDPRRKRP